MTTARCNTLHAIPKDPEPVVPVPARGPHRPPRPPKWP